MKLVFALAFCALATARFATEDTRVPEALVSTLSETPHSNFEDAKARYVLLQSQGKDNGACQSLANTEIDNVNKQVQEGQGLMDALSDGSECAALGQDEVTAAQNALDAATAAADAAAQGLQAAKDTQVQWPARTFEEANNDNNSCGWFWNGAGSGPFTDAKAKYDAAVVTDNDAKAAKVAAQAALDAANEEAKKLETECLCQAKDDHAAAWAAQQGLVDSNNKAWQKAHNLLCVVNDQSPCNVPATPVVSDKPPIAAAANANCVAPAPPAPEWPQLHNTHLPIACGGDVAATKGGNNVWYTWASPCSGGCSQVPLPEGGWDYCSADEVAYFDNGGVYQAMQNANPYCSSNIFDPKYNHCDMSDFKQRQYVAFKPNGASHELVICGHSDC